MMKQKITCLVIVILCAVSSFAQSKGTKRSTIPTVKPGYYFTIYMCHACAYSGWHEDAIKWFRAKGINASKGGGDISNNSNLPFALINAFNWKKSSFWLINLYVGPFASEEAAVSALDDFPSVLIRITEKRNKPDGRLKLDFEEDYPIDLNEVVTRTSGNNYHYGFFFITGFNLRSSGEKKADNHSSIKFFINDLAKAVSTGDKNSLAKMINFPLVDEWGDNPNNESEPLGCKTADQFFEKYDKIFTQDLKRSITAKKYRGWVNNVLDGDVIEKGEYLIPCFKDSSDNRPCNMFGIKKVNGTFKIYAIKFYS